MGLFSKLRKWFQPEEYHDPDLGRLTSVGSGDWNGSWTLEPGGKVVPFSISVRPESIPGEQRSFMLQVKDRFIEIEEELARTMFRGLIPATMVPPPKKSSPTCNSIRSILSTWNDHRGNGKSGT